MQRPLRWLLAALVLGVASGSAEADNPRRRGAQVQNQLAGERSPYLRQHAGNPVEWLPWGAAAFERARTLDRPIFLSVGYAACHWCHVMNRESFSNRRTAKLLNDAFVCVKVDREERPDVDRIYLHGVRALGRSGGWPMTVLLTPDGKPFWGGSYVSPEGLTTLVEKVRSEWEGDRSRLTAKADWAVREVQSLVTAPRLPDARLSDRDLVQGVRLEMESRFDRLNGGVTSTSKFPPHGMLLFFLDGRDGPMTTTELAQVAFTLAKMDEGGIHDHVGGGFHRYTIDERWFLPHFEKMLYDNALLIRAYARMYQRTGAERFKRTAARALLFVERDLRRSSGGYGSSVDAETAGEEGRSYTWSVEELGTVLDRMDLGFLTTLMGVRSGGNYTINDIGGRNGRNVLYLPAPVSEFARLNRTSSDLVWMRMDALLDRLHEVRRKRPQPALDDQVITAWNGLLLGAMADAGRILKDRSVIERARELGEFLLQQCRRPNGTLLRFPVGSGPEIMGFCEDYVHVIDGLLALAEATDERRYVTHAAELARRLLRGFEDADGGGFWATSHRGHETLIARAKDYIDSPIPSDNGTAAQVLLRLAELTGDSTFRDAGNRTISTYRPLLGKPAGALNMLTVVGAVKLRDDIERSATPVEGPVLSIRQDIVRVELFVEGRTSQVNDTARVRARVTLDGGWHCHANEPRTPGYVGAVFGAATSDAVRLDRVVYPTPIQKTLALGEDPLPLYEETFEITAEVRRTAITAEHPELVLTLQPCSGTSCREPVTIRLPLP